MAAIIVQGKKGDSSRMIRQLETAFLFLSLDWLVTSSMTSSWLKQEVKADLLQSFDESGEEVGDPAADLRAIVSQSSLVQKRHLTVNTAQVTHMGERRHTPTHTHTRLTRTVGMCCGSTMKNLS